MGQDFRKKLVLVIVIVAVVLSALVFFFVSGGMGSEEKNSPYFSKLEIMEKNLFEGENSLLRTKIKNPTNNSYSDVKIRITTKSPKIFINSTFPGANIEYENKDLAGDINLYVLDFNLPIGLGRKTETTTYTFSVEGETYPGYSSMTTEIEISLIADGRVMEEETMELTIEE